MQGVVCDFWRLEIGGETDFLVVPVRYALICQLGQILVPPLSQVVRECQAFFRAHLVDQQVVGAHIV